MFLQEPRAWEDPPECWVRCHPLSTHCTSKTDCMLADRHRQPRDVPVTSVSQTEMPPSMSLALGHQAWGSAGQRFRVTRHRLNAPALSRPLLCEPGGVTYPSVPYSLMCTVGTVTPAHSWSDA